MAINKKLANSILKMAETDQRSRFDSLKIKNKKIAEQKIISTDKENIIQAKRIIKQYNWPTFNLIGKRASRAFWLIIQHADLDIQFQKLCLKLLKNAVNNKQAFPQNEAYLADRVLINSGKKQIYGTQFYRNTKNKLVPRPIKNVKNIEKLRKSVRLESFTNYLQKMNNQ
ncbi:MAG TPA: hypothetical protein PLF70_01670 [Candidatus Portnoybacteria bacterium]|nr:hypothetical protein [Candidatus Portnoybacteria bacterium]